MNKRTILILFLVIGFICSVSAVSAHDNLENPVPDIVDPEPDSEVSGDVNIDVNVHEHNEVRYVNVTVENKETNEFFSKQDSNPYDGWSFTWDTSDFPNGEYYIESIACDVKGLEGSAHGITVILNNIPKESTIVLENVTTIVNKSTNLAVNLKGNDSSPISNKPVEFIIDGDSYFANTTKGGVAIVSFTPKEVKDYDIIVKFGGNYRYLESQTSGILKVIPLINSSSITVNDVRGNNKEKVLLKANLVCPGIYTNVNKKIEFYVNGNIVGYNFTDENGDAILEYVISETGGSYIYQARYQNESGENFTDSASLYVPQSELYRTMNTITYSKDGIFTVGNTFELNYYINNKGPDSATDVKVRYSVPDLVKYVKAIPTQGTVNYNSSTKELVWDLDEVSIGNQKLTITFTVLKAGKIDLLPAIYTSTYDESVNISNNNITRTTLSVKSYKLVASDLTKYFTGNQKYKIYLKDGDGKVVKGAKITLTFNKNVWHLSTNAKGYIELDTKNLKVGKFTIKATCNGLKISKKITVKPLLIAKNLSKKKSKTTKFSVKLVNNKGKAVSGKKLTFKFKGKKYTAKTNKKGVATVSLKNLKVGKYSITTTYGKSIIKNTIKIKK